MSQAGEWSPSKPCSLKAIGCRIEACAHHVADSAEPSGTVRVASPTSFFGFFQMEWVKRFLAKHPLVRLDFVLSDLLVDLIADRIDVAFRGGPLQVSSNVIRGIFASMSA